VPLQLLFSIFRGTGDAAILIPYLLGLALALVAGISFHEFSHAFSAYQLGDYTPVRQGRVTLNPAAHLDPIGMLIFVIAGFGWGRPVQFNPYNLRTNPRTGTALVAVAGPIANIILGTVCGLLLRLLVLAGFAGSSNSLFFAIALTLASFVEFNFLLAVFNLVPLPPLDGSNILPGLLPPDMGDSLLRFYSQMGPYSLIILFVLFWVAGSYIGPILFAPVDSLFTLAVGAPFFSFF
jgi:Zn-dependent protease